MFFPLGTETCLTWEAWHFQMEFMTLYHGNLISVWSVFGERLKGNERAEAQMKDVELRVWSSVNSKHSSGWSLALQNNLIWQCSRKESRGQWVCVYVKKRASVIEENYWSGWRGLMGEFSQTVTVTQWPYQVRCEKTSTGFSNLADRTYCVLLQTHFYLMYGF